MNGDETREMDDAWRAYLVQRDETTPEHLRFGWNPRKLFEAGWTAANVRSSGWYSGRE